MVLNKVITALDLSVIDPAVIRYLSQIADDFQMQQFYFMHIVKDLTRPENVELDFHRLFSPDHPLDEKIKASIQKEVGLHFDDAGDYSLEVEVHEGKPYKKLLHWAEVKNADLVVVGRKQESAGSGITSRRLAHNLKCSMLFVPEIIPETIKKIVVPTDFSEDSARALKGAIDIARQSKDVEVLAIHVIETFGADNYPGSLEYPMYVQRIRQAHASAFEEMLGKYGIDETKVKPVFLDDPALNIASQLDLYLSKNPADLVMMGAQGHSRFENFLYGSVTEQFVDRCDNVPILVVR